MAIRHNYQGTIIIGTDESDVNAQCVTAGIPLAFPPKIQSVEELDALLLKVIGVAQDVAGNWWTMGPNERIDLHGGMIAIFGGGVVSVVKEDYYGTSRTLNNAAIQGIFVSYQNRYIAANSAYDADVVLVNAGQTPTNLSAIPMPS
jgi:hypothetical protein